MFTRFEKRRMQRDNQVFTPSESQSRMFQFFVTSTLLSENMFNRFRRGPRGLTSEISLPQVGRGLSSEANYSIYPNYFTHVNFLKSEQWPILNIALESFLSESSENPMFQMFRAFAGLTSEEKVSLALQENTLEELMADPSKKEIIHDVFRAKGTYLFTLLRSKIGTAAFQEFISEILKEYRFKTLEVDKFCEIIENRFQFDFKPFIKDCYGTQQLPGFLISNIQGYEILDGNRTRFQVTFAVSNPEPVKGLMIVSFRVMGGGRGRGDGPGFGMGFDQQEIERIITIPAHQTKEVGIVLDSSPRMMMVNSLISKNVPSIITHFFEDFQKNNTLKPFDGERLLDHPIEITAADEIIVDNEDLGFKVFNPPSKSLLKKLLKISPAEESEKYSGVQFMRPPSKWVATTNPLYFGKYIRSAFYTKAGNGDRKVAWNSEIQESGSYDIYCYAIRMPRRRGDRDEQRDEQYHYRVYHDDGEDEAILNLRDAETGWNLLGTYYLSSGPAKVELTNESQGRIVVADAIKWVKR